MLKTAIGRLSYANIMAALALFVSLGGASYAAIELPAGSVGTKQLQAGAVKPSAIGFPLGAAVIEDNKAKTYPQSECNSVRYQKGPHMCPPTNEHGPGPYERPVSRDALYVNVATPGRLLITTVATVSDSGTSGTFARAYSGIAIDFHRIRINAETSVEEGGYAQLVQQEVVSVPAGRHVVSWSGGAKYPNGGPGDVSVQNLTITAVELPR